MMRIGYTEFLCCLLRFSEDQEDLCELVELLVECDVVVDEGEVPRLDGPDDDDDDVELAGNLLKISRRESLAVSLLSPEGVS